VKHQDPQLMRFGAAVVISPDGSHRMPAELRGDIAALVLLEPEPDLLPEWIGRIETKLKVGDEHRKRLADRAASAQDGREEKRRRLVEQSMRAARLNAPMRDPKTAAALAKKEAALAEAVRAAANPTGKTDRDIRKAAKQARARVKALTAELAELRAKEADQDRLYGEARETILLARARGAEVIAGQAKTAEFARDEHGARILNPVRRRLPNGKRETFMEPQLVYSTGLRAKNLTGLEQALASDLLNDGPLPPLVLLRIANDYRGAYLIGEGEISSGGEGGGGFGPKAPQPRRAEASQDLADMRRRLSDLQRKVLDLVCGKDMRCCEAARQVGLGDYRTAARVLRVGLKAARDGQWAARDARRANGDAGALSARIQAGNAMLATVRV
jgi:hypothetical protein